MKKINMTGKDFIGIPLPVLYMNIIRLFDTATGGDSPKDRGSEETNRIPCASCFRLLNICQAKREYGLSFMFRILSTIHPPSDILFQ
jgi:hypothetical protein